MLLEKVSFDDVHSFSPSFLDYIGQQPALQPFYSRFPVVSSFGEQIREKSSFQKEHREVLHRVLTAQYAELKHSDIVQKNIEALKEPNAFTVTTGHQLNIYTGPLYFIYKIVTVINTCRQLQAQYPAQRFVPVYWMASEDHDFEEISYFRLYGKKYSWKTSQTGAVGRFDPAGLSDWMNDIPGDISVFRDAYKQKTLADAVRYYVNALFGEFGVVVVDADNRDLKSTFKSVMRDDIFRNTTRREVDQTSNAMAEAGYKTSVHARDINFFYLDKNIRGRLEQRGEQFHVVDTSLQFSAMEIEKQIEETPEKFSPNVLLRPLYQETILPNLAYVGGPAEVVYWLQLKRVFDAHRTPFPMLMPRNFAMVMDAPTHRKFERTGLILKDLFEEKNYLFNHWVARNSDNHLTLSDAIQRMSGLFGEIHERALKIDKTLGPLVDAEATQVTNRLERIEKKFLKAEKRLHTDTLRQIEAIKDTLFPNGGLQERSDNFLCFYQSDQAFIQKLVEHFDPFDYQFNILSYA